MAITQSVAQTWLKKLEPLLLGLVIVMPPLFVLFVVQYSALTFPYWDHCELARFIVKYYDSGLSFADIAAPHNHTRPLTYRAIMIFNAVLTKWDIRSEYVYLYISLAAAFILQMHALWRVTGRELTTRYLAYLGAFSLLGFSPGAHNNYWWSMMFQLTLANVFILAAIIQVAFGPRSWRSNIVAAICCWAATYTLTNGLMAVVAIIVMIQLSAERLFRPNKLTIFWLVNTALILALYLPGLPEGPTTYPFADVMTNLRFVAIYIGAPLYYLLHFPFKGVWSGAEPYVNSQIAYLGWIVLIYVSYLGYKHRKDLVARRPATLLFVGLVVFTLSSAVVTAWGRAANFGGAEAGGTSRYTMFGAYIYFALFYFWASLKQAPGAVLEGQNIEVVTANTRRWWLKPVGYCVFAFASMASYRASMPVFREVHDYNMKLAKAFSGLTPQPDVDGFVYPDPGHVQWMRENLSRLKLGPYRYTFAQPKSGTPEHSQ